MIRALALGATVLTGVAVLVLRTRFVAVLVHGDSMRPTLRPGDRVLVRRVPVGRVRRGQVIVLAPPADLPAHEDDPPWLIKRVIALPGDPVPRALPALRAVRETRVPPGQVVVLGDNTARSYDSRRAGYFDAGTMLGVVVRRMWPAGR